MRVAFEVGRISGQKADFFTVVFYGRAIFCCKVTQICVTRRECLTSEILGVRDAVQRREKLRKNSLGNYKSAALNQLSYAGIC
jgi:predicted metal-binding transcription factor (methanogenesis marker protein 9)